LGIYVFNFIPISASETTVVVRANVQKYSEMIRQFKSTHGHQITDREFFDMIFAPNSDVNFGDCHVLWNEFKEIQKPFIEKETLISLLKAYRDSISDLSYSYKSVLSPITSESQLIANEENGRYVVSKQKVLLTLINDKNNTKDYDNYLLCYDGNVKYVVDYAIDEKMPNVSIDNITSFDQFYPMNSLLAFQALLDTKKVWNKTESFYDLVAFLENEGSVILENLEEYHGQNCIVATDGVYRFRICPDYNYAVLNKECYVTNFSKQHKTLERVLTNSVNFESYNNYGNSIWLTNKCIDESFSNGSPTVKIVTLFKNIKINSGIEDSVFTSVIPEDAIVFDGIRGFVYKQNDSSSIESLLRETAKSKRVFIYRYISIISGLVLIFIVLVIKYRLYLKDKRERENKIEEIK
jgi:outer membrane lipoprotein-sorting protein